MPETQTQESKRRYPFAFWICGCTEIFERMSFYLGRSLILVFVAATVATGGLGLSDITAAKMQSNLTAFSYLFALLGGFIVDRWIPPRVSTPIGMLIIAAGYFCGSMAHSAGMVYAIGRKDRKEGRPEVCLFHSLFSGKHRSPGWTTPGRCSLYQDFCSR